MPRRSAKTTAIATFVLLAAWGCSEGEAPAPPAAGGPGADGSALVEGEPSTHDVPPTTLEGVARAYAGERARRPQRTDWGGGDAAKGATLFATHCAICHGSGGAGDGLAALALNPKPRDFTGGTFYLDADANGETGEDVDLARVILEGPGAFGGSDAMQGWDEVFSDAQVRDLVAYVRSLSGSGADAG